MNNILVKAKMRRSLFCTMFCLSSFMLTLLFFVPIAFSQEMNHNGDTNAMPDSAGQGDGSEVDGGLDSGSGEISVSLEGSGESVQGDAYNYKDFPSLLFTDEEQAVMDLALNAKGFAKSVKDADFNRRGRRGAANSSEAPPPEDRFISLGGVAYKTRDNWAIWLNDERVTPLNLPSEILDLHVYKNYIEVRWFDEYTNKIYPLRLRSQQSFNLDSLVFSPG